jgi:hypothetical protein
MKIILTENQIEFIRRYKKIKELVDEGIDVLSQDTDICDYDFFGFLNEICWQVSDKLEHLNLPTDTVGMIENVHKWVKDNFDTYILEKFEIIMYDSNCNERFDDVDDEEYNLQESDNDQDDEDDKYYSSLKTSLIRRHNVIMEEMYHYINNLIDCDEYPDDVDGFKDHILEEVSDVMMYTHNINNWLWGDLYDMLNNLIGKQINDYYISWTRKHC